jgi:uncharacterized protein YdaU (DUF1376 family)
VNYYPFHLGDYAAHTAHLEPMEDLAYRRMLDLYYLRECALPAEPAEVARLIRMRGNVAEVEAVLREFFTSDDAGRSPRAVTFPYAKGAEEADTVSVVNAAKFR